MVILVVVAVERNDEELPEIVNALDSEGDGGNVSSLVRLRSLARLSYSELQIYRFLSHSY